MSIQMQENRYRLIRGSYFYICAEESPATLVQCVASHGVVHFLTVISGLYSLEFQFQFMNHTAIVFSHSYSSLLLLILIYFIIISVLCVLCVLTCRMDTQPSCLRQ